MSRLLELTVRPVYHVAYNEPMKKLPLVAALIFISAIVAQAQYTYTTKRDLVYSTVSARKLRLDLDLPHASAPHLLPVIIWLHPGNWDSGGYHGGPAAAQAKRGY